MKIFCIHNWELISETITKSKIEVLRDCGVTSLKGLYEPVDRKFIQILTCKNCGKLKRFVENI